MVGKHHSFFQLLQNDISHVILLRCICHSAALVASHACSFLPRSAEELLRSVYSYVSGSAKRSAQLQEMQEFFREKKHKMLKLATTRWLSRYECISRVLENWIPLEHYFTIAVHEDKLKSAEIILSELKNVYTKAYLLFLKYTLKLFNTFNTLFQNRKPLIHVLYSECMSLMRQLCRNYVQSAVLAKEDLSELNLKNPRIFLPLEEIYLGPECTELLKTTPPEGREVFIKNCLNFYIEGASDLQKRLPDKIFKNMGFLNPTLAFSKNDSERDINFAEIIKKFGSIINVDKTDLEIEWRSFCDLFSDLQVTRLKSLEVDEMWLEICSKKRFDETLAFPNLSQLANVLLVLPHSNAEAERIFSVVTDTKTKKRNRLAEKSLNSLCVFRSSLQDMGNDVVQYQITEDHLKLHNVKMYTFKNKNV